MPAPWTGGAEVKIVGRIHDQITNNVLHFATNQLISDPQTRDELILALLTALLPCIANQLAACVTSDWSLEHIEGHYIAPTKNEPHFLVSNDPVVGTLSPASVSFACSLVEKRTGTGGRSGRGKIFLPPPGEGETTNSISSNGVFQDLTAFINCVVGKFVGINATEGWRLGVLSGKQFANTPGNFDAAFREVETLVPKRTLAIMGRRKVGRGV